jgi:hypothetical protein
MDFRSPSTVLAYGKGMSKKNLPDHVKADTTFVAVAHDYFAYMVPVQSALGSMGLCTSLMKVQEQLKVFTGAFEDIRGLGIGVVESKANKLKSRERQRQADLASYNFLLQQKFYGIHQPLYQFLLEGKFATVKRCWWVDTDGDVQLHRSAIPSRMSPEREVVYDLADPTQIFEFFLVVVNTLQHLPEAYWKSVYEFQTEVVTGKWQERQVSKSNLARLNAGE